MKIIAKPISRNGQIETALKEDWGKLHVTLMAHAIKRYRYRYGVMENNVKLAERARDLISEVLDLLFFSGNRNWNTEAYPTFQDFIISVTDSHLNGQMNKKKEPVSNNLRLRLERQEERGTSQENDIIYGELRSEVYKQLEVLECSDEELMIFECMADGMVKPREIRADLGMSENDYHNNWRALKRKVKKLGKKLEVNGY